MSYDENALLKQLDELFDEDRFAEIEGKIRQLPREELSLELRFRLVSALNNQKKLEEQKALTLIEVTKQKNELLKQAQIDKDIEITKAEAEAKALQIKGQSVASNPRIVELEWINKWNGVLPTYMLGNNTNMMLGINK